jgi:hypothetical protein
MVELEFGEEYRSNRRENFARATLSTTHTYALVWGRTHISGIRRKVGECQTS